VAPPLRLAQDAVSLKLLPETTQKVFLRFALAELYKQVVSFLIAGQRRRTAAAPAFAMVAAAPAKLAS